MSEKNKERLEKVEEKLEKVEEFCSKHFCTLLLGGLGTFWLVLNNRYKKTTETMINDYRLYLMSRNNNE